VEQLREKYETEQTVLILVVILVLIKNRHKIRLQKEKQHQDHIRLQTIVHTQEEVQQSIARDIHDGLVQVMGAAKLSLQTISDQSDKDLILDRIQQASAIMDDACMEARHISHQLLPYSLMKDGLLPALDELLQKNFDAYRFHHSPDFRRLNSDVEINLYRIAQELVNNTLKHAGAKEVVLHLMVNSKGNAVDFRYQDDGKGFNIDARHRGVGLTNIITRATLIGGTAEISSQPGKGIVVQITAPL
jgi:signal transduction histidine kinase